MVCKRKNKEGERVMFPTLNLDTLAKEINQASVTASTKEIGKVFLTDYTANNQARIVIENGKPKKAETVKDKIKEYIQVLLRTELDKFHIYQGKNFGMTYFKYRGQKVPQSFILSNMKTEIENNLKRISLVDSITNFKTVLSEITVNVSFDVILKDGETFSVDA